MSKKSLIERNLKRLYLNTISLQKRNLLKKELELETDFNKKINLLNKIQKLPKNGSTTRIKRRCILTGKTRGINRMFNISRIQLRELALSSDLNGVIKSSW